MKDNETVVIVSEYFEEWYQEILICQKCETEFMTQKESTYCPYCGSKIIGHRKGNMATYKLEG